MVRPPGVVTVFTTTTCPHCRAAKALLATKDVNVVIWEVDLYPPEVREEMSRRAGGAKSVPQIFLNSKHLPGGNSNLQELEQAGKLDELLAEALKDPAGEDVPTVKAEKIPSPANESQVPSFGLGGLERTNEIEITMRKAVAGLRTAGFKGKVAGESIVRWLASNGFDSTAVANNLLKFGVIKSLAAGSDAFSPSQKYVFSADEDENVLNLAYDASQVRDLKAKRPAAEIVTLMRKKILKLYQAYLSSDGSKVDYRGIRASVDFDSYVDIACELQMITLQDLEAFSETARKAFFINLYNALAIHAFAAFGHGSNALGRLRFFNSVSYRMGGHLWSLNMIEHGILRSNRPTPAGFFPFFRGWMFSSLPLLASNDPRIKSVVKTLDPRIHFALNCGAKSCPPIKLFSAEALDKELQLAAEAFCEDSSNVLVNAAEGKVQLSMILKWYGRDFGENELKICSKVVEYLNGDKKKAMEVILAKGKVLLSFTPYDWGENAK